MTSTPADIAASALGVQPEAIVAVEPIKHGLTNQSWRVHTSSDVVIVRISTADEDALRIDRASEARILEAMAAAGVGAPVVRSDPTHHILVTRCIGPAWTFEEAANPRNIVRIAALLHRLHALSPPSSVREVDLRKTFTGYADTLNARGAAGELVSRTLLRRADELVTLLLTGGATALCHNDVHHLNVVDGGALRLIDWEYAGVGEPLFDLASVCVYHRYTGKQRETLLEAYTPKRDASIDARLDAALWLFEYIRDLWLAVRAYADRDAILPARP
jgi:thiamine kinase